jgi:CubicO group peptidase (beta-lactamase class C family)
MLLVGSFAGAAETVPHTRIALDNGRWQINGRTTNPGSAAEGLLMNVRMVNAVFEDPSKHPEFDPDANTARFIARIPDYAAHGVNAFTICLQGGMPGYEGAVNSAFEPDGSLLPAYLVRAERVIHACDQHGMAIILGLYYQRQSAILRDEAAVRAGVVHAARWVRDRGFENVLLEIANEYPHKGFVHALVRNPKSQAELIRLAKQTAPGLLVSASGYGDGRIDPEVAEAADFLLPHWNSTKVEEILARIEVLKKFGRPIVANEDDKTGTNAMAALRVCAQNGVSYGLMLERHNQHFPFHFDGAADDPVFYAELKKVTTAQTKPMSEANAHDYFPPPESQGGWRRISVPEQIRSLGGMDPAKLDDLRDWLVKSDDRDFAAVVIRHGYIVLQVERGNSAVTDSRRVASVSKAVCATVLAIASEQSQHGLTPRKMNFDDPAFDFVPWAQPLSDPRKGRITIKQLLNHTSGICPEATGAPNDGSWDYILGHTGDARTEKLAFDPGTGCGYSTHALDHAALVCETVTGKPYDQFAIEALFKPLGIEHWWFQFYDGTIGRHASHGLGMPARDLARIAYCMLHEGRWNDQQIIPRWFVDQTAEPTSDVKTPELRWKFNPQVFSHGWELPARHWPQSGRGGEGIPADAREKPGSGGQLIAFVPSLDLVITRQTGSSGEWAFEEYLRRACAAALKTESNAAKQ